MGISQRRISYAIGSAAWGSKAAQEGLPILEHFEPEPVTDASSAPALARNARLPSGDDFNIGTLYYVCEPSMLFSPAHSILLLDKFFENTVVGVSPNYERTYLTEDVPSDPSTPFINIWKKTGKVGHDNNLCVSNGIVTGITISKEPGRSVVFRSRLAFGARSLTESDPDAWTINHTNGNFNPFVDGDIIFQIATPGGAYATFKVVSFSINLSCAFTPHFFGSQNADRFSRDKFKLQGEMSLRDITDQVESFTSWLEGSTTKSAALAFGSFATLAFNFNIHAGGASEDEITRHGKFNFTGVYEPDAAIPTGFRFWVKAGRAYTP